MKPFITWGQITRSDLQSESVVPLNCSIMMTESGESASSLLSWGSLEVGGWLSDLVCCWHWSSLIGPHPEDTPARLTQMVSVTTTHGLVPITPPTSISDDLNTRHGILNILLCLEHLCENTRNGCSGWICMWVNSLSIRGLFYCGVFYSWKSSCCMNEAVLKGNSDCKGLTIHSTYLTRLILSPLFRLVLVIKWTITLSIH